VQAGDNSKKNSFFVAIVEAPPILPEQSEGKLSNYFELASFCTGKLPLVAWAC